MLETLYRPHHAGNVDGELIMHERTIKIAGALGIEAEVEEVGVELWCIHKYIYAYTTAMSPYMSSNLPCTADQS